MRVFLLGAGASKSYAQSPTGQRMPIARDFFPTFDKLEISQNPWVLQEGLIGYLLEAGVRDPHTYLRAGVDIEALHSEIENVRDTARALNKSIVEYYHSHRAYNELVFLFTSVINEIQNGPISEPHRAIAGMLTGQDSVITFNWDTLMDRALQAETVWRPDHGYGVTPHKIFRNGWKDIDQARHGQTGPYLVKLHGSTNWITAYTSPNEQGEIVLTHELDPATLHVFEHAEDPYACYAGRYMSNYQPFSYGYYPPNLTDVPGLRAPEGRVFLRARAKVPWKAEGLASDAGLVSMPMIIPPVKHKTYEMFGSLFAGLWHRAEDILATADEIVVIGYSFPITDIQSNELFKRSFVRRSTMPKLFILDPKPDSVAEKFQREFGISRDRITVAQDYFSEKFDLAKWLACS